MFDYLMVDPLATVIIFTFVLIVIGVPLTFQILKIHTLENIVDVLDELIAEEKGIPYRKRIRSPWL